MTLVNRAVKKVIDTIDSCETIEHLVGAKKMINFLYNYKVKSSTLTYVVLKYRSKHREIHYG